MPPASSEPGRSSTDSWSSGQNGGDPLACHVLRLNAESECGACGCDVPAGYRVITDQVETPFYVVVCEDCTSGLDGVRVALRLLEALAIRSASN